MEMLTSDPDSNTPHLMHFIREVVNSEHTGGGARYADSPGQAMNHHSPQLLAPSVLDMLMIHLR